MYNTLEKFIKESKSELNIDIRKDLTSKKGVAKFIEKLIKYRYHKLDRKD